MVIHKAALDAAEVERLVILVVVIFGAEVFIPVTGHILLEESYKVFEEFEAGDDELDFISRCSMCNLLSESLLWYIGTSEKRTLKK